MIKEITEVELAEMFNISLDQLKEEVGNGTFKCIAKDDNLFSFPMAESKPIKIVTDDVLVEENGLDLEISRKLSSLEAENLFMDLFGTTKVGMINANGAITSAFETNQNSPCDNCSNNPKNGGSGICYCTLGLRTLY